MYWFGRSWGAPICDPARHVFTPEGQPCGHCGERVEAGDFGVLVPYCTSEATLLRPLHYACHLRGVIGGINHLRGTCFCCGGADDPDPPELTKRQAALGAMELWERRQRERWRSHPDPDTGE